MTIYISTGGYKKKSADQITEDFINNNIKEIELSGGIYDPNLINNLTKVVVVEVNEHNILHPYSCNTSNCKYVLRIKN